MQQQNPPIPPGGKMIITKEQRLAAAQENAAMAMQMIQRILPKGYVLTFLARNHNDPTGATDIFLSADNPANVADIANRISKAVEAAQAAEAAKTPAEGEKPTTAPEKPKSGLIIPPGALG